MEHRIARTTAVLLAAMTSCAAPGPRWLATDRPFTFPIGDFGGFVTLPVRCGGKPACFVVDTGCADLFVDTAAWPHQPPAGTLKAHTPGGEHELRLVQSPAVQVGPFDLSTAGPVVSIDCGPLRAASGLPIVGILGLPVFRDVVLQLDFDHRSGRIFAPDDRPHPEWGEPRPMWLDDLSNPVIRATVAGVPTTLGVDTGAARTLLLLPRGPFDRLCRAVPGGTTTERELTAAGLATLRQVESVELQVDDETFADAAVGEAEMPNGLLGLDYLERHLVTFDLPHHRLYLKAGAELRRSTTHDLSGLVVYRAGPGWIVRSIDAATVVADTPPVDTPAGPAGVQVGDVLLEVDGRAAAKLTASALGDLLRPQEGHAVRLGVRRGGSVLQCPFEPRRPSTRR